MAMKVESEISGGFYRALRREVYAHLKAKGLSVRANRTAWLKFYFSLICVVTLYVTLFWLQPGFPLVLLVLSGLSVSIIFLKINCMHDVLHDSFAESSRVNAIMGYGMDVLGPSSYVWRNKHNQSHHRHTNHADLDNDISFSKIIRFSPDRAHSEFHRFQYIYVWLAYAIQSFFWFFFTDFKNMRRREVSGIPLTDYRKKELVLFLVLKFVHLTVAILIPGTVFGFSAALLGYAFVYGLSGLLLALIFVSAHIFEGSVFHVNERFKSGDQWAVAQVEGTSVFAPSSKFASFAFGGLNLQVIHHLFPEICNVHYIELWPIVERRCREEGVALHVFGSFRAVIASHYRFLKILGNAPEKSLA